MTEKPPVPITKILPCPECGEEGESDMSEDRLTCPFCSHEWGVTPEQLWLGGYHTRDARIAELESSLSDALRSADHWREMYRGTDLARAVAQSKVRELEAELEQAKAERLLFLEGEADSDARCEQLSAEIDRLKIAHSNSVTKLEAEVAELRKQRDESEANYQLLVSACEQNAKEEARRTPELTERVARFLHQKYAQEFETPPFEQLSELEERGFLHEADEILDLVFGKKEE